MTLRAQGIVARELPDVYRLTAVPVSSEQRLRAALMWAGDGAAADGRSAGESYRLEGGRAPLPEVVVPPGNRCRGQRIVVRRCADRRSLMVRALHGVRVTGPEATLLRPASLLDDEALEIACEDARRRRLTSVPALRSYLDRYAISGRSGVAAIRSLLGDLDPKHPSRSTLEVKARRLLVAHGITDFVREHPLEGPTRTYYFDFAFLAQHTIFETNGRRWHDDPADHEWNNEKWSVPALHGLKLVMATWDKVTKRPEALINELRTTLFASSAHNEPGGH